jgi:hypothetical protein
MYEYVYTYEHVNAFHPVINFACLRRPAYSTRPVSHSRGIQLCHAFRYIYYEKNTLQVQYGKLHSS